MFKLNQISFFILLICSTYSSQARDPKTMHMIFSTECNHYFDWQSLGLVHSFRSVGQAGRLTRLMACNRDSWPGASVADDSDGVVDTHVHPNWATHPHTRDSYPAYNKPASIIHWLEHTNTTAEYIIVLDADMILRRPFTIESVGAQKGRPIAAHYGYLIGVLPQNHMAIKAKVKNVERAQQVGGFVIMHIDDLRRVAPLWLKYTEAVRQDPDSWANTGDIFNDNGKRGPPWISEMYGYSFGCAEAGVTHQVSNKVMLYPGYQPPYSDPWPLVLHYGITYNIDDYAFDKHWHRSLDATTCPSKLFEKPMRKEDLRDPVGSAERRRKEVALDCAWGLFEATKDWKTRHCGEKDFPEPAYKKYHCSVASNGVNSCRIKTQKEITAPTGAYVDGCPAKDDSEACCGWAENSECASNPGFMLTSCKHACGMCSSGPPACIPRTPPPDYLPPSQPEQQSAFKAAATNSAGVKRKTIEDLRGGALSEKAQTLMESATVETDDLDKESPVAPVDYRAAALTLEGDFSGISEGAGTSGTTSEDENTLVEQETEEEETKEKEDPVVTESVISLGAVKIRTSMLFPLWGFAVLAFLAAVGVRGRQKKKVSTRIGSRGARSDSTTPNPRGTEGARPSALSRLEALDKEASKGR